MSAKHRILLAEDHSILREGLRALLAQEPDIEVVAEAENGRQAVLYTAQFRPDLVLMDLSMPYTNGTEAIHNIKTRYPSTHVLILTVHKTDEYIRAVLKAGANGYVLKDDSRAELLIAIRSVLGGKTYLSPAIVGSVINDFMDGSQPRTGSAPSWDLLTHREREVIKLVAEGYKNKEIARYLSLSEKTVEKHRSNLMRKLNLHSASQLTAYAITNGLVSRT